MSDARILSLAEQAAVVGSTNRDLIAGGLLRACATLTLADEFVDALAGHECLDGEYKGDGIYGDCGTCLRCRARAYQAARRKKD